MSVSADIQIAHLEIKVQHLEKQLDQMDAKLDQVIEALSGAKGGWRTLMWLGGAAAAAGGVMSWALTHVRIQ